VWGMATQPGFGLVWVWIGKAKTGRNEVSCWSLTSVSPRECLVRYYCYYYCMYSFVYSLLCGAMYIFTMKGVHMQCYEEDSIGLTGWKGGMQCNAGCGNSR
jgi:hypothetical protein